MIDKSPSQKITREPVWKRREFVIAVATVLLGLLIGAFRPDFLKPANLADIVLNSAITAVVAAGMTALIVAAEIDISVGAILAVCTVVVAMLARGSAAIPLQILGGIAMGAALGAVNGVLTAGLRIPSIVATLATLGAIRGVLVLVTHGDTLAVPDPLTTLGSTPILGLTVPVWVSALICAGMGLYLARTRLGRHHYAVGSNPRSAELSGIPVRWVTFRSFVLLGALTGAAAFLFVLRYTPIAPKPIPGFELEVITAVVVGGTDIFGGRGTVLGSVLAVLLLKTIDLALQFFGGSMPWLRSEVQPAVQGLLILAAVLYDSLSRRSEA
jgi:ribose/xylose/arabinose/galactoside ABC-type transport system permease subunit